MYYHQEESNMLRRIETRSFEECEMIVRLWLEGSREEAIEILGDCTCIARTRNPCKAEEACHSKSVI
jgi:hypothetical protein